MDFDHELAAGFGRLPVETGVDIDARRFLVEGDLVAGSVEQSERRIDRRARAARLDLQDDPFARRRPETELVPLRSVERAVDHDRQLLDRRRLLGVATVAQASLGDFGQGVHPEQEGVRDAVLGHRAQRVEARRRVGVDLDEQDGGVEVAVVGTPLTLQPILFGGLAEAGEGTGQGALDLHLAGQTVAFENQPQSATLLAAVGMHVEQIGRRSGGHGGRGHGHRGEAQGGGRQQSSTHCAPPAVISLRPLPSSGTGTNSCSNSPSAARYRRSEPSKPAVASSAPEGSKARV